MSAAVERIELRQLAPQRWKNGAGLTREIAVEPRGASVGDVDWRASVAEIAGDAPFSRFPGVDRCIVLLRGAGMTQPGTCLLWRHAGPRLQLRPAGADSRVLVAQLQRLCQDGGA